MAVSASLIAKMAASILGNKENRNKLFAVLSIIPAIIILVITLFIYLISGLFGLLESNNIAQNWISVRTNILDAFSSLNYTVDGEVKDTLYAFMPDFSISLSKANIAESYGSSLLVYDTEELEKSRSYMETAANRIRSCSNSDSFNSYLSQYGISGFSFSDFRSETFTNDEGIENIAGYDDTVRNCLSEIAQKQLTNYRYESYDYITADGKKAHKQLLTVTLSDGTYKKVEYISIGQVELYLPYFLALYQTRLVNDVLSEENGKNTYEDIGAAFAPIAEADNNDELHTGLDTFSKDVSSTLNIMQIAELKTILTSSLSGGHIETSTKQTSDDNGEKLTITLETPDDKEWSEVFDVSNEQSSTVTEFQTTIEQILIKNGIKESDLWLSLSDMYKDALFTYFEGFFNLPVESDDLRKGTNGILSVFGEYSDIHRVGWLSCFEDGVTLDLGAADVPVMIDLLPGEGSECFDDIVIYDIWNAEQHTNLDNNYLFGKSAITVAYYINTDKFKETYGFDFPVIRSEDGNSYETDGETITMLVEYSCLDSITLDESYIGESIIYDVLKGQYVIGYCHSGSYEQYDFATGGIDCYCHQFLTGDRPHISVKMDFYADYLNVSGKSGDNGYNGLSGHFYNNRINPLLWFKSFRTV